MDPYDEIAQELLDVIKEEEDLKDSQVALKARALEMNITLEEACLRESQDKYRYKLLAAIYKDLKNDPAKPELLATSEFCSRVAAVGAQIVEWPEGSEDVHTWVINLWSRNKMLAQRYQYSANRGIIPSKKRSQSSQNAINTGVDGCGGSDGEN